MAIREAFGLTLFGFDVITPTNEQGGESEIETESPVMVIDVNYFPSYKEVPDFPQRLKKYLWRLAYRQ
jgi:inositol-1,3,4-trisphosphate 5/6-kinase/inositol-tetrakisphosphate 1-kinase